MHAMLPSLIGSTVLALQGCAAARVKLEEAETASVKFPQALNVPDVEIFPIDVSCAAMWVKAAPDFLNNLPTCFGFENEAVDRLRAASVWSR